MKRKILSLAMVLAMLVLVAAPMAVSAAGTTDVTGTVAAGPTVTSVTPNSGNVSTAPTVTIVGTNFVTGQTTVQVIGGGITPGAATVSGTTNITCVFTIAAGAAAGPRNVYVTVAGKQSLEVVTFTVNSFITVNAPSAIALGYMTVGQTKTGTSATAGTVATNYATWQVNALDAKTTAKGYMNTLADGTGTSLADKFQLGRVLGIYTDADVTLNYPSQPATLPFFVSQYVTANATAGSYQITITFTGSGS